MNEVRRICGSLAMPTRAVCSFLFALAAIGVCSSAYAGGVIEGTVPLMKPGASTVSTARYQARNVAIPAAPAPAVVFLEGSFADAATASPPVQVAQKNLQFAPGVLPIQKGTTVEFPNQDDEYHNVLSYSKAKQFDLGRYRKEEKPPGIKFDKPGVVDLNCEIHEHMAATILVLDTPHFGSTDATGAFRLENLPAGKFVLKAWLNPRTVLSREVELREGQTLRVDFSER
jgi:plastocyanin